MGCGVVVVYQVAPLEIGQLLFFFTLSAAVFYTFSTPRDDCSRFCSCANDSPAKAQYAEYIRATSACEKVSSCLRVEIDAKAKNLAIKTDCNFSFGDAIKQQQNNKKTKRR